MTPIMLILVFFEIDNVDVGSIFDAGIGININKGYFSLTLSSFNNSNATFYWFIKYSIMVQILL